MKYNKIMNQQKLENIFVNCDLVDEVFFYDTIDSTQDEALNKLEDNPHSFIVYSTHQTKGRGRFNREWLSPKASGVYFTLAIKKEMDIQNIIGFNLFMSLAISKAIEKYFSISPKIKWPNDIYLNDKKICGFLTEVVSKKNTIEYIICGIGINVFHSSHLEVIETATSIEHEYPSMQIDIEAFLKILFEEIDIHVSQLLTVPFAHVKESWIERSNIFERTLTITEAHDVYKARALDIDDDGYLEVVDGDGNIKRVISADITLG